MTKVKVDLEILKKYFAEHYDFENNPSQFLRNGDYELEGRRHKDYVAVYNNIRALCSEFNLQDHTDIFFNLFFISKLVKIAQDMFAIGKSGEVDFKDQNGYKSELFPIFLALLVDDPKSLTLVTQKVDSPSFKITNTQLLDKFKSFIFDIVAEFYFGPGLKTDPDPGERIIMIHERIDILYNVLKWEESFGKKAMGARPKTYLIRKFVKSIESYLKAEAIDLVPSRRRNLFIGHLGVIYKIFPEPRKEQVEQGENYFVQTAENYVLKKS